MNKTSFQKKFNLVDRNDTSFYKQGIKHNSMADYDLDVYRKSDFFQYFSRSEEEYDITVCYTLWDNMFYVKYLYISLLSQLLFTDILNIKEIRIIVGDGLYPLVKGVLKPFLESDLQIKLQKVENQKVKRSNVTGELYLSGLNKYVVSLFEDIDSELLILSDCESFMYGKKGRVYSDIWNRYKSKENLPILGCEEHTPNRSVFLKRREDLAPLTVDDEEYIQWCSKRLDVSEDDFKEKIINIDNWFLTCFFAFDRDKFSYEDQDWENYVEWSSQYCMYCDESVYFTYGKGKKNYEFEDLSYINELTFVHLEESRIFFNKSSYEQTAVFHPLHGGYSEESWISDFYDEIIDRFDKLVENVLVEEKSFRSVLPQYKD